MTGYAEIAVTSNYSFLRGASHPQELIAAAAALGLCAIGIADRNSLAGVVRAWDALNRLRESGAATPKLLVGARLVFADGTADVLAYPQDRAAYGRLCRLLSLGKHRARKGDAEIRVRKRRVLNRLFKNKIVHNSGQLHIQGRLIYYALNQPDNVSSV